MINLTQDQIDNIAFNEGIVYLNFGKTTGTGLLETLLGPTRGGSEFDVSQKVRDIDYDGKPGKTKGMRVREEIDATLKISTLCCTQEMLDLALLSGSMNATTKKITSAAIGVIEDGHYLENVTVFAQLTNGKFKKITVFNPMHDAGFKFTSKPKSENEHSLEFSAHWNPLDFTDPIYTIEEVDTAPTQA